MLGKKFLIGNVIVGSLLVAASSPAFGSKTTQDLMKQKLAHAHALFTAVVSQQYPQIRTEAEALIEISKASSWHQTDSEDFHRYARNFQEALNSLTEQAKKTSAEGISLGYVQMSLACTSCHHKVRFDLKK